MNDETKNYIDQEIKKHIHDGNFSERINLFDIFGRLQTITTSTGLTNALTGAPRTLYEQMFIDTSTATKKLYIYDAVGGVWRSTTIT